MFQFFSTFTSFDDQKACLISLFCFVDDVYELRLFNGSKAYNASDKQKQLATEQGKARMRMRSLLTCIKALSKQELTNMSKPYHIV